MSSIFKVLVVSAPVLAILFYYVVVKQGVMDAEIQKEDAKFERAWNEFEASMATKDMAEKYNQRAKEAEQELERLRQEEELKKKKAEDFEKEFEQALKAQDKKSN